MTEAVVEMRGVTIGYDGEAVVSDFDLCITRGEIVCLIGGSGSGKSTILHAMIGLLPIMSGEVALFGVDLAHVPAEVDRGLRRRVGMLFQHDALFGDLTALDNVAMPAREIAGLPDALAVALARRKLALFGLTEVERHLPAELSGGQRKRAALSRAIVLDPELVFCDEPTGGLDPISAAHIDVSLERLRDTFGVTVVVVTHDIGTVSSIADRVVMLADGGVLAEGTPAELAASTDPYVRGFMHRTAWVAEQKRP